MLGGLELSVYSKPLPPGSLTSVVSITSGKTGTLKVAVMVVELVSTIEVG